MGQEMLLTTMKQVMLSDAADGWCSRDPAVGQAILLLVLQVLGHSNVVPQPALWQASTACTAPDACTP